MRVIRTLSESDSGSQREEQKRQLQTQFRETDATLDSLVLKKQKELTKVLQIYARVSNRLANARSRVAEIKSGLVACKELLHYKRDDLKVSVLISNTRIVKIFTSIVDRLLTSLAAHKTEDKLWILENHAIILRADFFDRFVLF